MFPLLINPLAALLTLTTSFGVLIHDTQIDKAAHVATALPAVLAAYGTADVASKLNDQHVHTERVAIASQQPRVQPRSSNDDKKYITVKKFSGDVCGSEYSWPSV